MKYSSKLSPKKKGINTVNKFWTIFKREYLTRVKTKGFIISTLLAPLFLLVLSIGPGLLMSLKSEKVKHISVIDLSGIVFSELITVLDDSVESGERLYQFTQIETNERNLDSVKTALRMDVDKNQLDGFVVIPADVTEKNESEYYSKNVSNFDFNRQLRSSISGIIRDYRLQQSNLDPELIASLTKWIDLRTFRVSKGGAEKEDIGLSFAVTFIMVFFLYFALIMYGQILMRSVYEEKLSRVVEVIISTCKPFQLMAGKVFGVGAVGLTQFSIWVVIAGLLTFYSSTIIQLFVGSSAATGFPDIPFSVLVYFILFFIGGYTLYASIYAALGAIVSTEEDAQQLVFPVVMLIIMAFIFSFYIIRHPNSTLSIVFSMIPFFAPITMFTRIAVINPPFIQVLASLALLLLTIFLILWLAGKIYRIGILMYGKRPTLPELLNWIRY